MNSHSELNHWIQGLQDKMWEVRATSAKALDAHCWTPSDLKEQVYYFLAKKDWNQLTDLVKDTYGHPKEPALHPLFIVQCIIVLSKNETSPEDLELITIVLLDLFKLRGRRVNTIDLLELLFNQVADPTPMVPVFLDTAFAITQKGMLISFDSVKENIKRILQILNNRVDPKLLISSFLTLVKDEIPAYHYPGDFDFGDLEGSPPYGHFASIFLELIKDLADIPFIAVIPTLHAAALYDESRWVRVTAAIALDQRIDEVKQFDQVLTYHIEHTILGLANCNPYLFVEFMNAIAKKLENPLPVVFTLFRVLENHEWDFGGHTLEFQLKLATAEILEKACWQSPDPSMLVDSINSFLKNTFFGDFDSSYWSYPMNWPVAWLLAVVLCRLSGIIPPISALQNHLQVLRNNPPVPDLHTYFKALRAKGLSKVGTTWPEICGGILLDLDQPEVVIPTLLDLLETHPPVAPVLGIVGGLLEDSTQLERSLLRALEPNNEVESYGYFIAWAIQKMESRLNDPAPLVQPLLRIIAEDKDHDAQVVALTTLILIGRRLEEKNNPQVATQACQMMEDAKGIIRSYVFESLQELKDERAVPYLTRVLNDPNFEEYVPWIADALIAIAPSTAIPLLIQTLTHKNRHVRISMVQALGTTRDPQALNAIVRTLLTDNDEDVQWHSIEALPLSFEELQRIGNKTAIPALVQSLRHSNINIRREAAVFLGRYDWSPADPTEEVYYHIAAQNWEEILKHGAGAIPLLLPFLQEAIYYKVRKGVVLTLYELGWRPENPNDLAHYLIAKEDWAAVVKLGSHAVLPLLKALQDDRPINILDWIKAIKALGKIGDPRAIKPLSQLEVNPNSEIKKIIDKTLKTLMQHAG